MKKYPVQVALGEVVRNLREQANYSQESFADQVGLHRTYVGSIERGERNISLQNLCRISKSLHIPLSTLFKQAEDRLREK